MVINFLFMYHFILRGRNINSGKDANIWTPHDTWDFKKKQRVNMINVYALCTCIKFIRKSIALYNEYVLAKEENIKIIEYKSSSSIVHSLPKVQ